MSEPRFTVVGIGNAIVDVLAHVDDQFIIENELTKGTMSLVDEAEAKIIYSKMELGVECSGGSAANTIASIASLGSSGAFIGKVKDDQLGKVFRHEITSLGITFKTIAETDGLSTARCMIHVTPDAQRTMQTFLGACKNLGPDDIDEAIISDSAITYLEGYLWDPELAKLAFRKAAKTAESAGRMVSLSLSDSFCVDRHRDEFLDFVKNHVNILFANEEEIKSLYQLKDFGSALQAVRGDCDIAALTRGGKGSVVVRGDEVHVVNAEPVDEVIDTTGAGDAYAAGFLHGLTTNRSLDTCARMGGICSAEIISHVGARPGVSLKNLVEEKI
jgi:sugar/nucleoside kinase (ribokinase family)